MRDNWINIITFTYPHEAHLAKGKLESEGIQVQIVDEMTVQVHNFYSQAIGGVKLSVPIDEAEEARKILVGSGYIKDMTSETTSSGHWFIRITDKIPWVNKVDVIHRVFLMLLMLFAVSASAIYFINKPSTAQLLLGRWCTDIVQYNGELYQTQTEDYSQIHLVMVTCEEAIVIEGGTIWLPGFRSEAIHANAIVYGDSLYIRNSDTFGYVYDGAYKVDIHYDQLKLISTKTIIHAKRHKGWFQ